MDQSKRDLMKFGGLGFLGIATGISNTPEGILMPHDKIVTLAEAKAEAMIMASGYLTNISIDAQIETLPQRHIGLRAERQRIISNTGVDMNLSFEPNSVNIHESFYDYPTLMKVIIYR